MKTIRWITMVLSTAAIAILVLWLALGHKGLLGRAHAHSPSSTNSQSTEIQVNSDGSIAIEKSSRLLQRLTISDAHRGQVHFPKLEVSGSIIARVRSGTEPVNDRWQFDRAELSDAYAEWLRAQSEVEFAERQLQKTTELAQAQTKYLKESLDRVKPLATTGSFPEKNLREAEADYLRAQIQGDKDIFSAQSTLRLATKSKAALDRQLSQAGIESVVLTRAVENMVLIAANVPESRISQVMEGQACEVRFYGYPDQSFPAHVESLGASLNQSRRVLRVLFDLNDPTGHLKPGMFADVSLGTDTRDAVMIPTSALVHIGRSDYVVVEDRPGALRVAHVELGDSHHGSFEIISGLTGTERIVSAGVILLKPLIVQSLKAISDSGS